MSDDGPEPADRIVKMWGESCSTGLWTSTGMAIFPDELPISMELQEQLSALASWYDELDLQAPEQSSPWEGQAGMPTAPFIARTRELAHALKAELPADWTVEAFDADDWRWPSDDRAHRKLLLPGSATRD